MKASHTIRPVFDDPNLVSAAGLVPVLRLAESAGLHDLLEQQLSVASPNATTKTASVVGGMLAGADSIDDLDLLRHGAMPRLFPGVRAPSTLGTFLRTFTHGHVQQLDAVGGDLLAGLPRGCQRWSPAATPSKASRSSTSTTPSARSTATPSKPPPSATPGCGG